MFSHSPRLWEKGRAYRTWVLLLLNIENGFNKLSLIHTGRIWWLNSSINCCSLLLLCSYHYRVCSLPLKLCSIITVYMLCPFVCQLHSASSTPWVNRTSSTTCLLGPTTSSADRRSIGNVRNFFFFFFFFCYYLISFVCMQDCVCLCVAMLFGCSSMATAFYVFTVL